MKLLVVNNPTSGGRSKNQRTVRELRDFLRSNNIDFKLESTTPQENAEQIVSDLDDYDHLVIVGGDGTINEAVNGLKKDLTVSIIPAGTGNDFVKNVPLKKRLADQFQTIIDGSEWKIDLGECNGRKFVNGVGIGFDGQIVHDMGGKKVPFLKGHAKYYFHVLTILASYAERDFNYLMNDGNYSEPLILLTIGNGTTFGGGFKLMPDAKLDDGLLDVCRIGPISAVRRFLNIAKLSNGTHGKLREVTFEKTSEIFIERNELLHAHADGEYIGQPPYNIRISKKALTLRV